MIQETPDVWMSAIMRKEKIEGLKTYDLGSCSEALVSYRVRKVLRGSPVESQQMDPGLVVGGIRGGGMSMWLFGSDAPTHLEARDAPEQLQTVKHPTNYKCDRDVDTGNIRCPGRSQ